MATIGLLIDNALATDARNFAAIEAGQEVRKRREGTLSMVDAMDLAIKSLPPRRGALLCQLLLERARQRVGHAH